MPYHVLVALGTGMLALGASIFHLGRPRYAFRAVLGLKRSWLSREIVAFGLFAVLATIYALSCWSTLFPDVFIIDGAATATAIVGAIGIFCSAMVYKVTRRPFWDHPMTVVKFFMTIGILGIATIVWTTIIFFQGNKEFTFAVVPLPMRVLCVVLSIMTAIKLLVDSGIFLHLYERELTSLKKTALLMTGPFRSIVVWRFVCGFAGGILLPILWLHSSAEREFFQILWLSTGILSLSLLGEFLERYLFFRAVVPLKMPGAKS